MHDRIGLKQINSSPNKALGQLKNVNSVQVNGVSDLIHQFDVFVFSAQSTLISKSMTLPSGAILVPKLRQLGKRVGVFCSEETNCREDVIHQFNRCGYSITGNRILMHDELCQLEDRFPLVARERVLMVCSDLVQEVAHMQNLGLRTLLIGQGGEESSLHFAITPDFIANSV